MKRFLLNLSLIFSRIRWGYRRRRLDPKDRSEAFKLAQAWAKLVLKRTHATLIVKNTNLIPLEDGYTFAVNPESQEDALILLGTHPLQFRFFIEANQRVPWVKPYLDRLGSIRYTRNSVDDDLIAMSQALNRHQNFVLFLPQEQGQYPSASILDAAYLSKTAIVPVAIRNSVSLMRFGKQRITVSFCMPLHYEEYGQIKPQQTLEELRARITNTLKEG